MKALLVLLLVAALGPEPPGLATLRVTFLPPEGAAQVSEGEQPGRLVVRSGEREVRALPISFFEPLDLEIPLGESVVLTVESERFWAPPHPVVLSQTEPTAREVPIRLWPAGEIRGQLEPPRGEPRQVESLEVSFEFSSGLASAPGHHSQPCHVEGLRFTCAAPAGWLDLRLQVPGYISQYRFESEVPAGGAYDAGKLTLRRGASVVGRVETTTGVPPERGGRVRLELVSPTGNSAVDRDATLSKMALTGLVDGRGFFHLQDVAPGAYRLRVEVSGYAPSEIEPLRVLEGRETTLPQPIVLHPPVIFTLLVDPPADPYDRPWRASLFDYEGQREVLLEEDGAGSGRFRAEQMTPGPYSLRLDSGSGRYEYRWWNEDVEIEPQDQVFDLSLPVVEIEGRVLYGEEPIEAILWFGGRNGPRKLLIDADEEGRFTGYLPEPGVWDLTVYNPEVGVRNLQPVEVTMRTTGRKAHPLEIVIPGGGLRGEVVDADGEPAVDAVVTVFHLEQRHAVEEERTDNEGRFEFHGLASGSLIVSARDTESGQSSAGEMVQLEEDEPSPDVRLVLERRIEVTGRVLASDRPVAGAQIEYLPLRPGTADVQVTTQQVTGVDGRFRFEIPEGAVGLDLRIFPPGYAARFLHVPSPRAEEEVQVQVEPGGGTLILEYPVPEPAAGSRQVLPPQLHASGVQVLLPSLLRWARFHGGAATPGRLAVAAMQPGDYRLCLTPDQCVSGFLPPHGELVLRIAP